MRVHIHRWQILIASASLLALVPQAVSLRSANAAPQHRGAPPPPQPQSIELSRMKEGLPPNPNTQDGRVHKAAVDPAILKAKYEDAKRNADALAELALALKSDLDKGNENVAPLDVPQRAEKIEKLAKKLKKWGKGE